MSKPYPDQELIKKIRTELIDSSYYNDISNGIHSKTIWKSVSDATEVVAHIFLGTASILAFASGFFNYTLLAFFSGCSGTIALVLLRFSVFAMGESKERTEEVNILLNKLGMEEIPNIAIGSPDDPINSTIQNPPQQNNINTNTKQNIPSVIHDFTTSDNKNPLNV